MNAQIFATYENTELGLKAYVLESAIGGYGVSLQDVDSGQFFGAIHGYKTIEAAKAKAMESMK